MSKSSIEWTQETWNPIVGCSILSPGCTHCYAMGMAARIEAINQALVDGGKPMASPQYAGTTKKVNGHTVWTGKLAMAGDNILLQPLKRKKPTTYFVNSMGDLFHEDVPDAWIDKVFAVMALAPQHTFQVLTKRAKRMRDYFAGCDGTRTVFVGDEWTTAWSRRAGVRSAMAEVAKGRPDLLGKVRQLPLPNVWLGVSTERQQEADERIPELLQTPAAVRFISAEPLLGPILSRWATWSAGLDEIRFLDWVIVGGESGADSRPMHPDWARSLRVQCESAGVPFFFKQWGNWAPHKVEAGGDLGGDVRSGRVRVVHPSARDSVDLLQESGGTRQTERGSRYMINLGKSGAGRSLDGIEYSEMPACHAEALAKAGGLL